jgi:protein gp37
MKMAHRLEAMGQEKYTGLTEVVNGNVVWNGKVNLDHEALEQPFHWRNPRMIFVNSMSDLFHEQVPFEFIREAILTMIMNSKHTYQILTKRPQRMLEWWNWYEKEWLIGDRPHGFPKNIWLGVSVENQHAADERIPLLLQVPARVRFLSCEPLLEPVDLPFNDEFPSADGGCYEDARHGIHWVIIGGESGPGARFMSKGWALDLVEQCKAAGVSVFVKQLGGYPDKRDRMEEWPDYLQVQEFPDDGR